MSHAVVSRDAWLSARTALLAEEKAFTRARDALSERRRALPWVKVEKDYVFQGPQGPVALGDLFQDKSQLIVYHFMYGGDYEQGCKSCSFWADSFDPAIVHLNQRDVAMVVISRAPVETLEAFRKRMGWNFLWLSSGANSFNADYGVSPPEKDGTMTYNYTGGKSGMNELPGISVFAKGDDGAIHHTYSCYARGLDMMNAAYQLLDLMPKGRDESAFPFSMAWVKHHDRY
jgi:predicted dithiol-disulfide oxidoreductase (DUF899 family)